MPNTIDIKYNNDLLATYQQVGGYWRVIFQERRLANLANQLIYQYNSFQDMKDHVEQLGFTLDPASDPTVGNASTIGDHLRLGPKVPKAEPPLAKPSLGSSGIRMSPSVTKKDAEKGEKKKSEKAMSERKKLEQELLAKKNAAQAEPKQKKRLGRARSHAISYIYKRKKDPNQTYYFECTRIAHSVAKDRNFLNLPADSHRYLRQFRLFLCLL